MKEFHPSEYREAINGATTILEASSINSPSARTLSHTSGISQPFLWKKTTCRVHGWLQYTIHNLRPFNSCENLDVFRHIKHETISQKTLLKYVENLTELVEKKLSQLLPEKFALMLDGWSTTNTHYIGIMAIFRSENTNGYSSVLLGLSPLENEETQCANEHYDLLNYVLGIYGKGVANVVALIGDNCATNRSLSRLFSCSFVGCASHRFNLAVKDLLLPHKDIILKVAEMMKKLRAPLKRAILRKFTDLTPIVCNVTRWSSTYDMLKRFLELRDVLPQLHIAELDDLMPVRRETQQLELLCSTLSELDSVTKCLQRDNTTMAEVRALFDTVIEHYPAMKSRLGPTAEIVECPAFESAVVLIQRQKTSLLTAEEKHAVRSLRIENTATTPENQTLTLAEKALHCHMMENYGGAEYNDTRFILPTTNLIERLFSNTRRAYTDYRRNISPTHFESQMFLYCNRDHWTIADVNSIVQ